MNQNFRHRQFPAGNPLASVLVVVVGALVIGLSLVLGFVALVALAGFMLVMGIVVSVRSWWYRRNLSSKGAAESQARRPRRGGQPVIEGEFTEIEDNRDRHGPDA